MLSRRFAYTQASNPLLCQTVLACILGFASIAALFCNPVPLHAQSVGVVPEKPNQCPSGSSYVWLQTDDEDKPNHSSRSGWTGATMQNWSGTATRLGFCTVPGNFFKPHPMFSYAVLLLDSGCPQGSVRIRREFDTENKNNNSQHGGNIFPNSHKNKPRGDTFYRMYFCHFPKGGQVDPSFSREHYFPNFNVPYGVLAPGSPEWTLAAGTVSIDDEDDNNQNFYGYEKPLPGGVAKLEQYKSCGAIPFNGVCEWISGDKNTVLQLSKVSSGTECKTSKEIAGPDIMLLSCCEGKLGTQAEPGYKYSWSPAVGLSCTQCAQPTVKAPQSEQLYTLEVTCPSGSHSISQVKVTGIWLPSGWGDCC